MTTDGGGARLEPRAASKLNANPIEPIVSAADDVSKPVVLVPARPPTAEEMARAGGTRAPWSARSVLADAQQAGWTVRVTYAHGRFLEKDIESIALRMRRGDQRCLAFWHNGSLRSALIPSDPAPFKPVKAREFRAWLKLTERAPDYTQETLW